MLELDPHTLRMGIILLSVVVTIALYATERFAIELVSTAVIAFYLVFFHLWPEPHSTFGAKEVLSGFANPALIAVLALLVVGQGMFHTGALEGPSRRLVAAHEKHPTMTMAVLFGFVILISAFINNTPVVVMFIPVLVAISTRTGSAPSAVMMPLSFVSILAGMTTLIGSSTNLLVADVLKEKEGIELGFFAVTPFGLILAGAGLLYLLFIGRHLLPHHHARDTAKRSGQQYLAQIELHAGHPHLGERPVAGMYAHLNTVTVRMVQRGDVSFFPPFDERATLQEGDILTVAATRKALVELLISDPEVLSSMVRGNSDENIDPADSMAITEAVVAPGSRYTGRSLEQLDFANKTGCIVLGVQRRSRMLRQKLSTIRLEAGDDLLIFGTRKTLRALRFNKDLLVLLWSMSDIPDLRRANRARLIFGAVIVAAASGLIPIIVAALMGAVAMVMSGCLNVRQAGRALDLRIYLLIAAAFAMGASLHETGAAAMLAETAVNLALPYGPMALLLGLFAIVAILTNILSNAATAVLFAPIAVDAAVKFSDTPQMEHKLAIAAILTVIYAANCSFATPVAYQTNLLVMGPGQYKFVDYFKAGAPLVVILWVVFALIAPFYFHL